MKEIGDGTLSSFVSAVEAGNTGLSDAVSVVVSTEAAYGLGGIYSAPKFRGA